MDSTSPIKNLKGSSYWISSLTKFHNKLKFDGLWIDMNEIANFCTGACIPEDVVPFEESIKSEMIYTPGQVDLEEHSISIDAKHFDGNNELDYHSLFGHLQGISTNKFFTSLGKRPFIISRSTFSGSGAYVSHWNGDNFASWEMLEYSIIGTMNMNIFGIPLTGSDICGFMGNTNEDLCEKWTLVGAFYPFSRNHNALGSTP
jgi:alpha-glucosidase (family GH31 glycosyl hydrolase)